jgi:hypothetical protein
LDSSHRLKIFGSLKENLGSPQNEAKFGQVGNAALVMWSGGNLAM